MFCLVPGATLPRCFWWKWAATATAAIQKRLHCAANWFVCCCLTTLCWLYCLSPSFFNFAISFAAHHDMFTTSSFAALHFFYLKAQIKVNLGSFFFSKTTIFGNDTLFLSQSISLMWQNWCWLTDWPKNLMELIFVRLFARLSD